MNHSAVDTRWINHLLWGWTPKVLLKIQILRGTQGAANLSIAVSSPSGNKLLRVAARITEDWLTCHRQARHLAQFSAFAWGAQEFHCSRRYQHSPVSSSVLLGTDWPYLSLDVRHGHVTCFSQWNVSKSAGHHFQVEAFHFQCLTLQLALPLLFWFKRLYVPGAQFQDGGDSFCLNPWITTWRAIALETHLHSQWTCIKPMRFGGCLLPQHDISYPEWHTVIPFLQQDGVSGQVRWGSRWMHSRSQGMIKIDRTSFL